MKSLSGIVRALGVLVGEIDGQGLTASQALRCVDEFSALERLAAAGRMIAARRVTETRAWRSSGASSPAAWMAKSAGSTLAHAGVLLQSASDLDSLPEVRDALVAGRLSETQVAEVVSTAVIDPSATSDLLLLAERESVAALRDRCKDVRAAAIGDELTSDRIRADRYTRIFTDREGAVRLSAKMAPDDAAGLVAAVRSQTEMIRADAARSGAPVESTEAYAADALVSLADGVPAPRSVVHVHVSGDALARGHTVAGETCRIEGIGPISVSAAKRLASRGTVKVIERAGVDVRLVAHAGRAIPAHLRSALEVRDPTCVVPDCNRRYGLEIDHIVPFADGGETTIANLARLCRWHHSQKTHRGWRLEGHPGEWAWVSPKFTMLASEQEPRTRGP